VRARKDEKNEMSDREARAMAAAEFVEVDGKQFKLRPISIQNLVDLEREAMSHYKRQYLMTYRDNADLLGDDAKSMLRQKMEEVAKWELHDLPQKDVFDTSQVPLTDAVKKWLEENFGQLPDTDTAIHAVLVTALDTGQLKSSELKKLTGKLPIQGRVRFDQWWVTGSMEGMLSLITTSIRQEHPDLTAKDVSSWPLAKIIETARLVEGVTSASMGNG